MLIRNVKPETMAFLKNKAAARGHSVQDEVREVLDGLYDGEREEHRRAMRETRRRAREIRQRLATTGRYFGDSAADIREDRDTDHGRS
jgi:plasmid stability protein